MEKKSCKKSIVCCTVPKGTSRILCPDKYYFISHLALQISKYKREKAEKNPTRSQKQHYLTKKKKPADNVLN